MEMFDDGFTIIIMKQNITVMKKIKNISGNRNHFTGLWKLLIDLNTKTKRGKTSINSNNGTKTKTRRKGKIETGN